MKKKRAMKFPVCYLIILIFSYCSQNERGDEAKILSLIYNTQIGNHEHFGSTPPVPPLPPDFDELNNYDSNAKATQELISKEWKEYFAEDSTYESRVGQWQERMRGLKRKILFNTNTEISEHYREVITRSLEKNKYDLHFLEESKNWKLSDIENKGSYKILDLAEFGEIRLDSIHVGVMQFSDIGFNENRDTAILYYDWLCGTLCGGGNVTILQKEGDTWKIIETMNLWVA